MIPVTRSQILVAAPTDPIEGVLDRMAGSRVGSILIVNSMRVLGIFTERDVLLKWRMWENQATRKRPISDFMSQPVITIRANEIDQAARLMIEKHIRHLPVIDNKHNLIGVISSRDFLPSVGETAVQESLKVGVAQHVTIHMVMPSFGLAEVVSDIMPTSWQMIEWNSLASLISGKDFKTHLSKPNTVVFIDLDGVDVQGRNKLLKDLIVLMKQTEHPKVFFCYSTEKVTEPEIEQLRQIAKKINWFIFEKPLALAPLFEAFRTI